MDFENFECPKRPKTILKTYGRSPKLVQKANDARILHAVELKPVEKVNLSTKEVEDTTTKNAVNTLLPEVENLTTKNAVNCLLPEVEDLTTKNAVSFLLAGTLTSKVCRYCLSVTEDLYELEKVMEIANKGGIYSVAIKDMIASFHPFKVCLSTYNNLDTITLQIFCL